MDRSVTYVFRENVKNNELAVNPLGLTIVRLTPTRRSIRRSSRVETFGPCGESGYPARPDVHGNTLENSGLLPRVRSGRGLCAQSRGRQLSDKLSKSLALPI